MRSDRLVIHVGHPLPMRLLGIAAAFVGAASVVGGLGFIPDADPSEFAALPVALGVLAVGSWIGGVRDRCILDRTAGTLRRRKDFLGFALDDRTVSIRGARSVRHRSHVEHTGAGPPTTMTVHHVAIAAGRTEPVLESRWDLRASSAATRLARFLGVEVVRQDDR